MPAHAAARMVQARLVDDGLVATPAASAQDSLRPALSGSLSGAALPDYQYGVVRKQDRHPAPQDDDEAASLLPQQDQATASANPATPASSATPATSTTAPVNASPEGLTALADTPGLTDALQPAFQGFVEGGPQAPGPLEMAAGLAGLAGVVAVGSGKHRGDGGKAPAPLAGNRPGNGNDPADGTGATPTPDPAPSSPPAPAPVQPSPTPVLPPLTPQPPPAAPQPAPAPRPPGPPEPSPPAVAPDYDAHAVSKSVAHDGRIVIEAEILAGKTPEHAPAHVRIEHIAPLNAPPGAASALLIERTVDGQPQIEAVSVGQIISLDDFDKLRWSAEGNDGGHFSFVPLDADQRVIEDVPVQKIVIHEHLPVPVYDPAAMTVYVAHDQVRAISPALLDGTDPTRQPAGVRVLGIQPGEPVPADAAPLLLDGQPVQAGQWISREDFGKLSWHAAQGTGGSFRFVPTNADGTSILGADPQTVTLTEDPLPPVYNDGAAPLVVAHDGTRKIDPLRLTGTDIGRKPDYIRITAIDENGASGQTPTALQRFLPAGTGTGQADDGPAGNTPDSSTGAPGGNGDGNNTGAPNGSTTGSHSGTPGGNSNDSGSTGALPAPGAAGLTITLGVGSIVPFAAFRHLSWNADGNEGGSFSFVPSTADGRPLEGATEQHVRIVEDPLPPVYPPTSEPLVVAHDGMQAIGAMRLTGSDIKRKPDYIRITGIDENGHDGPPRALQLPGEIDASGQVTGSTPILLSEGSIVPFAAFRHLSWNAQGNDGGRFGFVPSTADGRPLEGATEQSVQIRESSAPPDYSSPSRLDAQHDQATILPSSLLTGQDDDQAPARIRILAIDLNEAPAGGPALPADAAARSLFILQDDGQRQYLSAGQSVDRPDFHRLHWDGTANSGGSIRIDPLEADGQAIIGAQARTITIVEHPVAPRYDATALIQHASTDARISIGQAFFAAQDGTAPDHVRIDAIIVNNPEAGRTALSRNGVPVQAPLVLSRTDAENLFWDAGGNQGGTIRFTPILADGTPILGAEPQQLTVHESPRPPAYADGTPDRGIPHEGTAFLPAELLTGTDAQRLPAHIRITAISPQADPDAPADAPALWLDRDGPGGTPGIALTADGQPIPLADLAHLRWDALHNQGGELRFTPLDGSHMPILDSDGKPLSVRIGVHESPQAPDYNSPARQLLAHDKAAQALGASAFEGGSPAHAPAHIRIEAITETGDSHPEESALGYRQDDGSIVRVQQDTTLSREQYSRLLWDSDSNQGGSIRFTPLDGNGRPIAGSQTGTLEVAEDLPPPVYPRAPDVLSLQNGETLQIGSIQRFAGSNTASMPPAIRITAIEENGATGQPPASLIMRNPDGTEQPVKVGQTIALTEVPRLYWKGNADAGDGGRILFVPTHADGKQILGSDERALTIFEHPKAPDYPASQPLQVVAHDGTLNLDRSLLAGSDSQREPSHIRILSVDPQAPTGSALPLGLRPDDSPDSTPVPVTVGQDISRSEFGRLVWNAAGNSGGSFRFEAMVADGRVPDGMDPIAGSGPQTITVHESPVAPDYGTPARLHVAHGQAASFAAEVFAGSDPSRKPARIRIDSIHEEQDQQTGRSPLFFIDGQGARTYLSVNTTIPSGLFDKIQWDAAVNQGGHLKITPLDAEGVAIAGSSARTITVHESPVAPHYDAHAGPVIVGHDKSTGFATALLAGSQHSESTAAIRITAIHTNGGHSGNPGPLSVLSADGSGPARTIQANDTVSADEFSRLRWNGQGNDGGHFSFVPLDAAGHEILLPAGTGTTASTVPAQRIEVHESPIPPSYGSSLIADAEHNTPVQLQRQLFAGSIDSAAPAFVRIEAISTQQGGQQVDGTGSLILHHGTDKARTIRPGDPNGDNIISATDFSNLTWDSTRSDGGSITFQPLDASRHAIVDAPAQTIRINESPQQPAYAGYGDTIRVAHGQVHTFDRTVFAGTDPALEPPHVWIQTLTPTGDTGSGKEALLIDRGQNTERAIPRVGNSMVLSRADFDKVSWDTSQNEGGSFTFLPLDESLRLIQPAKQQNYVVHESQPAPVYASDTQHGAAHGRETSYNRQQIFGSTNQASFVRIERITENNDTALTESPLRLQRSNSTTSVVSNDSVISLQDFQSLSWSTAHNSGGSFLVVPLDAQSRPIVGASPVQYSIYESPKAPNYNNAPASKTSPHNSEVSFSKAQVFGTGTPAPFARIEIISELQSNRPQDASPIRLLQSGGRSSSVSHGQIIAAHEFTNLYWSSVHNAGGSFRVIPLDDQQRDILGASPQQYAVRESAPVPAFSSMSPHFSVPHDQARALDKTIFTGTDPNLAPGSIRIDNVSLPSGSGSGRALYIYHGTGQQREVSRGDTIKFDDLNQLSWNAAHNEGGSFRFTALDKEGLPILGAVVTVTVHEEPPPHVPVRAGGQPDSPVAAHNRMTFLDKATFIGKDPHATTDNRFFKILNIFAYESINGTREINWHENHENREPTAYELIKVPAGISRSDAIARATAAGGKLLNINDSDQYGPGSSDEERLWLERSLLNRSGLSMTSIHHEGSDAAATLQAFVIEYPDYKHPLQLHDANNLSQASAIHEGQVIGESELERISWNTTLNNGGRLRFQEVTGRAQLDDSGTTQDPNAPGNRAKDGTTAVEVTITEARQGEVIVGKGLPALQKQGRHHENHLQAEGLFSDAHADEMARPSFSTPLWNAHRPDSLLDMLTSAPHL